uniref:Glycosyltransferase RgtA/B/C/D-like domain-containing protein n=1 Tax=Staphylothermus marinus TaxID=2280 RepID=A0A7C4H986_STAMA
MNSFKKTSVFGLVILIVSIIIHICLGYLFINSRDVYDELSSWFHIYVVKSIRSGNFRVIDYSLRYFTGRNLLQSPIVFNFLIALMNIELGLWTILMSVLLLITIYYITRLITGSEIVAGFSSLLVSVTPCFNYWFKYNIYGAYTLLPFFYIVLILMHRGFVYNNSKLLILATIIGSILWFTWSDGWLLILLYSLFLSTLLFRNILFKTHLYLGLLFLATTLPLNLLLNYMYITIFHVFSYLSLMFTLIFIYLTNLFREIIGSYSQTSFRIIVSISVFLLSLYFSLIIGSYYQYPGLMEEYRAIYNPLFDYGIISLLSLPALIMIIRSRILQDTGMRFLNFALVSSFIVCVISAYFNQPLSVLAAVSIAPYISLSIVTISSTIYRSGVGRLKIIYSIIAIWLVIGSIVSSTIPSYAVSRYSPLVNIVDIPRELVRKIVVNESGFINTLSLIKDVEKNKLIICYWKYSYWVLGVLGPGALTLADASGDEYGWRVYSWIMLSDEHTAYQLIKKIVGNNSDIDVYVIVSEVISIDLTVTGERRTADLGEAIVFPTVQPGRAAEVTYQVHGDIARILEYSRKAGFNQSDYLTSRGLRYPHEYPLGWSFKTMDTVLVKLIVNGLDSLNIDVFNSVYNRLYGERFLNRDISKPIYFKLVNATVTPLYRVDRDVYSFQISLFVALYKVEL